MAVYWLGSRHMGKYSDTLMDHFMAPRNSGPLESPDVTGHAARRARAVSDSLSANRGGPGRRGEVSDVWLRLDHRVRVDSMGRMTAVQNALGQRATQLYDSQGRRLADINPLGLADQLCL